MADAPVLDWTGPCPKCGYVRTEADTNPAWQCPRCQVAYNKYKTPWTAAAFAHDAPAAPIQQRVAAHAGAMARRASSDYSLAALVATNLFALAVAWYTGMSLRDMMFVYWIQSVVIGVCSAIRIRKLHAFTSGGLLMNDQPVPETPAGKRQVASFFGLHYGIFHSMYLTFIVSSDKHYALGELGTWWGYALITLSFIVTHAFSLRRNLESDISGRPNIATLMALPYARILPMHLTIVFGAKLGGTLPFAFLLFGGLKILADCIMHVATHHILARDAQRALESTEIVSDGSFSREK